MKKIILAIVAIMTAKRVKELFADTLTSITLMLLYLLVTE